MKRLFHLGCSPIPGSEDTMTKDEAAVNIIQMVTSRFPGCTVVMTYIGKLGNGWNYFISVDGPDDNEEEN